MDIEGSKENLEEFKKKFDIEVFEVSAINNTGLDKLIEYIAKTLDEIEETPLYKDTEIESHVLYKFKRENHLLLQKSQMLG